MELPAAFLDRPIAHRALHGPGAPENSREAVARAVAGSYGIEIDIQASRDGAAMVFHDYDLARLTGASGPIQQRSAGELAEIPLLGGVTGAPTLVEALEQVAGTVPLLIEIKDQDGALGPNVGALEAAVAAAIAGYDGPLAVMSFNPHSVAAMAELAPDVPRGLVTCDFAPADWPMVPEARLAELRGLLDTERVQASFISHDRRDLRSAPVARLKAEGLQVLCWTVRSAEQESEARKVAANITFEGYTPA